MDQNSVAQLQVSLRNQSIVSGDENFRDGGRGDPVHASGNGGKSAFLDDNIFSVGAAGSESEDAVALLPIHRTWTKFSNLAGKLKPRDVLNHSRRRGVFALALQQIGAVECGSVNAHLHLPRPMLEG